MAGMIQGKSVDFGFVMQRVRAVLSELPDARRGKNLHYRMADAGLSAFSVFFMQCASFLEYQRRIQQEQGYNDAQSLFGVHEIACDNQLRHLLDAVPAQALEPLSEELLQCLMSQGVMEYYLTLAGKVLLALDGGTYFSSHTLHCARCSQRSHAGHVVKPQCAHTGAGAARLPPEFVTAYDGHSKQDCELNAARRWLARHGQH